jgi:hypothetical protein
LANEQLVLCLLDSKQYSAKVKTFIDNYLLKLSINEETENLNLSNDSQPELKEPSPAKEPKPHIPIEKVLNKMKKKEEAVMDFISVNNIPEKTVLNFEIFLSKWERHVMLENQYIEINNILDLIKSNLIKMSKRELNNNKLNIHTVGSYRNMTMRNNYLVIDVIVEYSDNLNKDGVLDKSLNCLNDIQELREEEFKFTRCRLENDIYDTQDTKVRKYMD